MKDGMEGLRGLLQSVQQVLQERLTVLTGRAAAVGGAEKAFTDLDERVRQLRDRKAVRRG